MDEQSDGIFSDLEYSSMCRSKSFSTNNKFWVALKEAVSKIEIPKDFDKLNVMIGLKENSFSANYAN